jgi:hypothetical protein
MKRARTIAIATMLAALVVVGIAPGAWASWTVGSASGGYGHAQAASVDPGPTPAVQVYSNEVLITWAATTLTDGTAVTGYIVKRSGAIVCTVSALGCLDTSIPSGSWTYTVTASYSGWTGPEGSPSTSVITPSTPPNGTLWMWVTP